MNTSEVLPIGCILTMLSSIRINHIALLISDLEKGRAFYGGILNLTELKRPDFTIPGIWYQLGDSQLHLMLLKELRNPQSHTENITVQPHFSLYVSVDDYHSIKKSLLSSQVEFVEELPDLMTGSLQAFFFDFDANMIELITFQ